MHLRHICLEYPYEQLQAATKNFHDSHLLGAGMAGSVFRGEMPDGSDVAVKSIDLALLGADAAVSGFEEEIAMLSKFRHPNLVVLMGWARRDSRRFLIYEFLQGGDAYQRLTKCKDEGRPFPWHERVAVARDAATGLAHLHNATPHAFHRDIKCANILLGPSGAKMADFGLSCVANTHPSGLKFASVQVEFASGTPGYTCPTYVERGRITEGSEAYAFGMVLLELLLNKMPAGMVGGSLVYPIREAIRPDLPDALQRAVQQADPRAAFPLGAATDLVGLALSCIQPEDLRRPKFNDICRALRAIQERYPPQEPARSSPPIFGQQILGPQVRQSGYLSYGQQAPQAPIQYVVPQAAPQAAQQPQLERRASGSSVAVWPSGADLALEVLQITGCAVAPGRILAPAITGEESGRRTAQVGRHCQAQWFEAQLADPTHRNSISRVAFEVSWGAERPATLRALGSSFIGVDDVPIVQKDQSVSMQPGSEVRFMYTAAGNTLHPLLTLAVRCVAAESGPAPPLSLPTAPMPPAAASSVASQVEGGWKLECVYAAGMTPAVFAEVPPRLKTVTFNLPPGAPPMMMGRQHQTSMFEALLREQKELLAFVSRNHLQLEGVTGGIKTTNQSQNITIVGSSVLQQGESGQLNNGDTLSFAGLEEMIPGVEATPAAVGDGTVSIAPFLTFRLVSAAGAAGIAPASTPLMVLPPPYPVEGSAAQVPGA